MRQILSATQPQHKIAHFIIYSSRALTSSSSQ